MKSRLNNVLRENLLIAALAFGKTPDMCSLLRPFVEEINAINGKGGIPININKKIVMFLVIPHIWTLDSVAKCDVLRKVQYNGYCGCPYCHHAGSSVDGQVRYCRENNGCERSNENTRDAMKSAYLSGKPVRGYHGLSPLIALDLDLVWQIAIDKMHNIDLGVFKKMFELFLSSTSSGHG
jgi:hypothetical protein